MADRGVLSTRQRTTSTLVEIYQDIVALLTCDFVCQPLPELNGMPGVYLIRQGNDHFQVIGIGIVTVIQLDVLADFMHLQCVGFQYPFDCRLDTCYRCISSAISHVVIHTSPSVVWIPCPLSVMIPRFTVGFYLSEILLAVSRFLELTKSA